MRAILIDPTNHTVTEVDCSGSIYDKDGVPGIYALTDVDVLTVIILSNRNRETLYLDDEGLLKENHFFLLGEYPQPLGGKGLILGTDDDGESAPTALDLDLVKSRVMFVGALGDPPRDFSHLATLEVYAL